jgi:hypothetical protein
MIFSSVLDFRVLRLYLGQRHIERTTRNCGRHEFEGQALGQQLGALHYLMELFQHARQPP